MNDSKDYLTDQELFWSGFFGDEYVSRNQGSKILASKISLFSKALDNRGAIESCVEFGANIGLNLRALGLLYPGQFQEAIEINDSAAQKLKLFLKEECVHNESIMNFKTDKIFDLVLIAGVLIHLAPEVLTEVYSKLVASCGRYLLISEYYSPSPVEVDYRGHKGKLFKRDFAGELMDAHPEMRLVDYGFVYHRDPAFPLDDTTWFLMEKV